MPRVTADDAKRCTSIGVMDSDCVVTMVGVEYRPGCHAILNFPDGKQGYCEWDELASAIQYEKPLHYRRYSAAVSWEHHEKWDEVTPQMKRLFSVGQHWMWTRDIPEHIDWQGERIPHEIISMELVIWEVGMHKLWCDRVADAPWKTLSLDIPKGSDELLELHDGYLKWMYYDSESTYELKRLP